MVAWLFAGIATAVLSHRTKSAYNAGQSTAIRTFRYDMRASVLLEANRNCAASFRTTAARR